MKGIVLIFITLFSVLSVNAQHLKFMGIPITGTITQFTQKLAQRGITIHPRNKKLNVPNCRMFKGVFYGQDAEIYVNYNTKTKIVYSVKPVIASNSIKFVSDLKDEITKQIEYKYTYTKESSSTDLGTPCTDYTIYNPNLIGYITIFTKDYGSEYEDLGERYGLIMIYTDDFNDKKNEKSITEDI